MWMDVLRKKKVDASVRRNERDITNSLYSSLLKVVFKVKLQSDKFLLFT